MKALHLVLFATLLPAVAFGRQLTLDSWIAAELTPYVIEQLTTHPRFNDQSLRFVVLESGKPQATSNALAIRIRDHLRNAASSAPGIRLAWQPDNPHFLTPGGPGGVDCTKTEVHYLIGVEINIDADGLLGVEIRALDMEDRSVVPGFGRKWKGRLTPRQYREFRRTESDPTFRGERQVPYDESQSDLLAAHLAHELGCLLMRQTEAEYVITRSVEAAEDEPPTNMVELVSNNLAKYSTLQFSSGIASANSVIEGKAHRIDDDLYQYWITVQPKDSDTGLQALSASAYIRLPEQFAIAKPYAGARYPDMHRDRAFLASLKIVELPERRACLAGSFRGDTNRTRYPHEVYGDCFALALDSSDDAIVFFLNHQLNNGLVRLADASCRHNTGARIVKSKQLLQFPLPPDALASAAWSPAESWQLEPDLDTYYALATTDSKAARALSQHINRLPMRCSSSVRPGLEGIALRHWLDGLKRIVEKWESSIDWQTIRVRNVY